MGFATTKICLELYHRVTAFAGDAPHRAYEQMFDDHLALIRSALPAHGGSEANTLGDGFFAAFSSVRACVAAVLEMQQAIEARAWPAGEQVRARMGIHTGEAAQTAAGLVPGG